MNAITLTHTGSEPRVDSRQLAKQLGTKHKNPMALIERYLAKFEEFLLPYKLLNYMTGSHSNYQYIRYSMGDHIQIPSQLVHLQLLKTLTSVHFALRSCRS